MKTKKLGANGPEISVVGFGAWEAGGSAWGPAPPDRQTIDAMRAAIDSGMTWMDTAEIYGGGRSEELVAHALRGRDALVFTKVAPSPGGSGFRPNEIKAAARRSLQRLERDVIDLYQLHWRSGDVALEDTWGAMAELVDDGLVRWIGVSNFAREDIERCEAIHHVDSLQPHFSMLRQKGKDDLFPWLEENGIGIICYGPLAFGILTGAFSKGHAFADDDWRSGKLGMAHYYDHLFAPDVFDEHLDRVETLRPVADRMGATLSQLALAWVTHQRGVTAAIAGSRSPEHVRDNAGAGTLDLQEKDLEEIDLILAA